MTNKSFEQIYKDFSPKLKTMFSKKITDTQEVEDLIQETLLRVYNKFHTYDSSKSALNTWIYTVAFSVQANHFKTKSRQLKVTHCKEIYDNEYTESYDSPENLIISAEQFDAFIIAAEELNKDFFAVYSLKELQDYSLKEIADKLDIPLGTVKSRLKRAKDHIKERLGGDV